MERPQKGRALHTDLYPDAAEEPLREMEEAGAELTDTAAALQLLGES